jgi:hypothetical protein
MFNKANSAAVSTILADFKDTKNQGITDVRALWNPVYSLDIWGEEN